MQKKVTIIGAGAVGSTTAYSLLARGAASEVVLIDINTEKALGEVAEKVAFFAEKEGLSAHARSATVRIKGDITRE